MNSVKDNQDDLKDLFGETIKEMMETEMDSHIGSLKNEQNLECNNYRNGYKEKKF